MGMGILTVESRIYKCGVFSNKGILILLKINGSRSVNSRKLLNIFMKEHLNSFILFTKVSTLLHPPSLTSLCPHSARLGGWLQSKSNILLAFQHKINTFFIDILQLASCQPTTMKNNKAVIDVVNKIF